MFMIPKIDEVPLHRLETGNGERNHPDVSRYKWVDKIVTNSIRELKLEPRGAETFAGHIQFK